MCMKPHIKKQNKIKKQIANTILNKKNEAGVTTLPDFKIYYKSIII